MTSIEEKRNAFRNYLESAGAIESISKALIRLYEEQNKPDNAVKFLRKHMCESCPDEEEFEILKADLEEARQTICSLQKEKQHCKDKLKRTDSEIIETLEEEFLKLSTDEACHSLLKKHLTGEVFEELKEVRTKFGSTLLDCINSGLENHDSGCGIYAADADAYEAFGSLFNPIIEEYHIGFTPDSTHPPCDWGDVNTIGDLDPEREFIVSTRVRCGRSMEEFPFNPNMKEKQYLELMNQVKEVLLGLTDEYAGEFCELLGMEKEKQQQLIDDHFLFKEGDRFLQSANACRFWPVGRAIFYNSSKTFLVWVNEEDHLRIISMEEHGNLGNVYKRLVNAVDELSKSLKFARSDRFGFLTFCPTNLGTTIRASVHIKLPLLSKDLDRMEAEAANYNLQVRGSAGEHSEAVGGIYDISNKRRLGLTEFEAVTEMSEGIAKLIAIEKELQG